MDLVRVQEIKWEGSGTLESGNYTLVYGKRNANVKRDANGEWRRLHNEELHSTVHLIKSRRLRWAGHVARMEEGRTALKILADKPTGKRLSGRPMHR